MTFHSSSHSLVQIDGKKHDQKPIEWSNTKSHSVVGTDNQVRVD